MFVFLAMLDHEEDKRKFEKVYHKYKRLMYRVILDILHNKHDAEDVLQEAFIIVTKNLKNIGEIDCHETRNYLVIISRTTCYKHLKQQKKKDDNLNDPLEDFSDTLSGGVTSEEFVEQAEDIEALTKCILSLQKNYADVLFLKYDNNLSNKDIATVLGMSQENVRQTILRAKHALEKKLTEKGGKKHVFR